MLVTDGTYTIDSVSPSLLLTVKTKTKAATGTRWYICITTTSTSGGIAGFLLPPHLFRTVDVFGVAVGCCEYLFFIPSFNYSRTTCPRHWEIPMQGTWESWPWTQTAKRKCQYFGCFGAQEPQNTNIFVLALCPEATMYRIFFGLPCLNGFR